MLAAPVAAAMGVNPDTDRYVMYTVKKVFDFYFPSRDVTNQTLPGRELVTSRLGTGKPTTFYLVYCISKTAKLNVVIQPLTTISIPPKSIYYLKKIKTKIIFGRQSPHFCIVTTDI